MKICFSILLSLFAFHPLCLANVLLPAVFSDHMVIQQGTDVAFWGWAKPGEEVTITGSWDPNTKYTHRTNAQGKWRMNVTTPSDEQGPHEIYINGYNRIVIKDVLIGEVWLGSGQSNMEWSADMGIDDANRAIANANYPEIRFFNVGHMSSEYPQEDVKGIWEICTPETMRHTSAIGYFFSRDLHLKLNRPVGFINSSWGGTPAEIWVSEDAITSDDLLNKAAKKLVQEPWGPKDPGLAYNAMIRPLAPYRIKGALWYQGESNVPNARTYQRLLSKLIRHWRGLWGHDFSFYFAQIAPFDYGKDHIRGAIVRDQQRRVLSKTPRTGMVVISDIGNIEDIHPRNKVDVAHRFANLAFHHNYGIKQQAISGPIYKEHFIRGNKIVLYFLHDEDGLQCDGKLDHFEVAGDDGVYAPAIAKIVDKTIEVQSDRVANPTRVRFAMTNTAEPCLKNSAGLPASCFATYTDY